MNQSSPPLGRQLGIPGCEPITPGRNKLAFWQVRELWVPYLGAFWRGPRRFLGSSSPFAG